MKTFTEFLQEEITLDESIFINSKNNYLVKSEQGNYFYFDKIKRLGKEIPVTKNFKFEKNDEILSNPRTFTTDIKDIKEVPEVKIKGFKIQ